MIRSTHNEDQTRLRFIGGFDTVDLFRNRCRKTELKPTDAMKALVRYYTGKNIDPPVHLEDDMTPVDSPAFVGLVNSKNKSGKSKERRSIIHAEFSPEDAQDYENYIKSHKIQKMDLTENIMKDYCAQPPIHAGRYRIEIFEHPEDYGNLLILHDLGTPSKSRDLLNKDAKRDNIYLIDADFFGKKMYDREIIEVDENGQATFQAKFTDPTQMAYNKAVLDEMFEPDYHSEINHYA